MANTSCKHQLPKRLGKDIVLPYFKKQQMKIFAVKDQKSKTITEYLDYSRIPYDSISLWIPTLDTFGRNIIDQDLTESTDVLLIMGHDIFYEMCVWETSLNNLVKFCNNGNTIWIINDADSMYNSIVYHSTLLALSTQVRQGSIKIFHDGALSDRYSLTKIKNIVFANLPYNFFFRFTRIFKSNCDKKHCSKDYMLTTIKKVRAPHRQILFNQLSNVPGLLNKGHVSYQSQEKRIGDQPHHGGWGDGYPSMDLYLDSWLELVPETFYKDGFFVTEKTIKPITTKTPFLTVSNCRYLEYLRRFGFKTFDSIIDERYDQQYRIEDRVELMLEQLQDIISNGSESFYKQCLPILEYNQERLFEIIGRKQYDTDIFVARHLEELGIK